MPLWVWIVLLVALIKLPLAAMMLWIPFRNDEAMRAPDVPGSSEENGGSKALPGGPLDPHPRVPLPRGPRRGPHGSPTPASPPRVRTTVKSTPPAHVSD
ncbi:MAG: hypothetical protein ACLQQB_07025 [Solirubrobacteraceae bacterium]|jgi:hypothetical protein